MDGSDSHRSIVALGHRDEAREKLAAYAEMVSQCQSSHFSREVGRLERIVLCPSLIQGVQETKP